MGPGLRYYGGGGLRPVLLIVILFLLSGRGRTRLQRRSACEGVLMTEALPPLKQLSRRKSRLPRTSGKRSTSHQTGASCPNQR